MFGNKLLSLSAPCNFFEILSPGVIVDGGLLMLIGDSWMVLNGNHVSTYIHYQQEGCISSVPNSSSGLIFVKMRAESGRIFSENPGKIWAKIRAKLNFVILSSFYDLGHVQTGILRFGEQLHNALNVH